MKITMKQVGALSFLTFSLYGVNSYADDVSSLVSGDTPKAPSQEVKSIKKPKTVVIQDNVPPVAIRTNVYNGTVCQRLGLFQNVCKPFALSFYKPTYVLPFYYTGLTYQSIYSGQTPNNEPIKNEEFKYQLSFKLPIWHNSMSRPSTLYAAYTQLSYWQVYNKRAFFRETDYSPEIFLANQINIPLGQYAQFQFLNAGLEHQSNGVGDQLERDWNRFYIEGVVTNPNWILSLKPWVVLKNSQYEHDNPDLAHYLGYEQILFAYKFNTEVVSLRTFNTFESNFRRPGVELTWSIPFMKDLSFFVQGFTGYGQSLIEYNHHTNSVGIGFSLNDWL